MEITSLPESWESLAAMAWENWTTVTEFVFKGFMDHLDLQVTLFVVFLLLYVITVVGNLGIIAVVWLNSQLQTPMYFFLSNLSFLDLCCSSAVTPKMLLNLSLERKTISFAGCFTQLHFYGAFVTVECYLLAVMAYDRYVAICNPLCYPVVMFPSWLGPMWLGFLIRWCSRGLHCGCPSAAPTSLTTSATGHRCQNWPALIFASTKCCYLLLGASMGSPPYQSSSSPTAASQSPS